MSHSFPYHHVHQGHIYYEHSSGPPVSRRSRFEEQSGTSNTPIGDQSYSQPYHSVDPVREQLEAHDVEDATYSTNQPQTNVLLQLPSVPTDDATYTNGDDPLQPSIYLPYDHYIALDYGQFQHQSYEPCYDLQSYIPNAQTSSNFAQDFPVPQTSQGSSASNYPHSSSTQLLSLDHREPIYQTNFDAPLIPANLSQKGVNTATLELPSANTGQHSHSYPVVTSSSNQSSVPGPSRLQPSSPERKRLLPLAADEEHPTARRVVPRSDRACSVHSTDSYIPGRGRVIPQERYSSNIITSYNTPAPYASIMFNLENPNQIGIPIIDILNQTGSFSRLQNRTEAFDMEKKTFTLRILWPGYEPWSKTISAMDWKKTRAPVKRVKLADAVAKAVRDLIKKQRNERCHPDYAEWNVGRDGIRLDQICLIALFHVSRGSWQPQFCLIAPGR